jgi:hypothetical protein
MMLTPSEPQERGSDARRIKAALAAMGAEGLCEALGLCDGAPRPSRGSWWRTARGVCVCCPVHNDTRPSCNVDANGAELVWLCRSCNAAGGALDLVAAVQSIDARSAFRELLDAAARVAGVADTRGAYTPRPAPSRPARPAPAPRVALDPDTFARVADAILTDPLTALDRHPEPPDERECCACGCVDVRRYLEDRAVLDLALRDGWRSLPTHPSERAQLARNVVAKVGREAWEASGLVLSWHDRETGERKVLASEFRRPHHRVCIPWRDRAGRVTALQRRLLLAVELDAKAWPRRRLLTDPRDPRIPEADRRIVGGGKYESAGTILDPYGAHRLAAHPQGAPVAFTEGAADALALEVLHREGARERDPDATPLPLVGLAIGSTSTWSPDWRELARDRPALVGLDVDAKDNATDATSESIAADLEGVAASVAEVVPQLDGERVKDWGELLERVRW